jgi:hypothetical protein
MALFNKPRYIAKLMAGGINEADARAFADALHEALRVQPATPARESRDAWVVVVTMGSLLFVTGFLFAKHFLFR